MFSEVSVDLGWSFKVISVRVTSGTFVTCTPVLYILICIVEFFLHRALVEFCKLKQNRTITIILLPRLKLKLFKPHRHSTIRMSVVCYTRAPWLNGTTFQRLQYRPIFFCSSVITMTMRLMILAVSMLISSAWRQHYKDHKKLSRNSFVLTKSKLCTHNLHCVLENSEFCKSRWF